MFIQCALVKGNLHLKFYILKFSCNLRFSCQNSCISLLTEACIIMLVSHVDYVRSILYNVLNIQSCAFNTWGMCLLFNFQLKYCYFRMLGQPFIMTKSLYPST